MEAKKKAKTNQPNKQKNHTKNKTQNTPKLIKKEIRFVITRGEGWGAFDRSGQKVQTYSYKINKDWGCDVHVDYRKHCCTAYLKVVKRLNPKSSHHKEKKHFFSLSLFIFKFLYDMMDVN